MGRSVEKLKIFTVDNCEFEIKQVPGGVLAFTNGHRGMLVLLRQKDSERVAIGQFEDERSLCDWVANETNRGNWIIETRLNTNV
jgi:hypothetical protein